MTQDEAGSTADRPVVLDTDVFSRLLVTKNRKVAGDELRRREHWARELTGRTLVIAAQTRAELLTWPLIGGWGSDRTEALEQTIAGVGLLPVDDEVQRTYARLTAWARTAGHAIHDKVHTGDRWIAASSIAFGLPLASDDRIFDGVDGLDRLPGAELPRP